MSKNKKTILAFIALLNLFSFQLFVPFTLQAQDNNVDFSSALTVVNSLDSTQKAKAIFPFDDMSRYDWNYLPASLIPRRGVSLKDLDSTKKKNVYTLLKSFLSDKGFLRTQDIMNNEYYLKELEPNMIHRIPENHFIAFYGTPAKDSVWGWKFSGHHIALNFTVVNNQLALTPIFFGVYPAEIKEGNNKGRRIIKDEEDIGFELINMFTNEQKAKAIFQSKAFNDIVTTNAIQVGPLTPAGIVAKDLTIQQKNILNKLIVCHLSSMPANIAEMRMKRIVAEDFNQIRFGWAGGLVKGVPHYYRIQGKTFLIEFDNTTHNANHIHIVWRDFDGDFGVDLLNEHYKKSKHHHK
jgi:Protein of unknown function (DUF3500)